MLVALRNSQKGQPLQGLLIGHRTMAPATGLVLTATRMVPVDSVVESLAALINAHLRCWDRATVIGWTLLLDKECHLAKLASLYFDCFARALIRCILANLGETLEGEASLTELIEEIRDLLAPMVGLVIVREVSGEYSIREYCAYQAEFTTERILAIVSEQSIGELDLFSGVNARAISHHEDLDTLGMAGLDLLLDVLRNEELESSDMAAAPVADSTAEDALGALAAAQQKALRKTRRRRASISSDVGLLSPEQPSREFALLAGGRRPRLLPITPIDVEIIPEDGCLFLGAVDDRRLDPAGLDLATAIASKEARLREIHRHNLSLLEDYSTRCRELELLVLVYKVLSQPDEAIAKKMSALEDHEERLKKLGAKLKTSLSPEDLLRTLASIQPMSP